MKDRSATKQVLHFRRDSSSTWESVKIDLPSDFKNHVEQSAWLHEELIKACGAIPHNWHLTHDRGDEEAEQVPDTDDSDPCHCASCDRYLGEGSNPGELCAACQELEVGECYPDGGCI